MSVHNTGKKVSVIRDELNIKGGGLYCYLPFENLDRHKKAVFKIGLAIDYIHRTDSYHTYFPQGVYMVAFLESPPVPRFTRRTEGKTKKSHYQTIEKFILDYIDNHEGKRIYSTTRIRNANEEKEGITEWIYTDEETIHEAFTEAKLKFQGKLHIYHLRNINQIAKQSQKKMPNYIGKIIYHFV